MTDTVNKENSALFWGGCLPARLAVAGLAMYRPQPWMQAAAAVPAAVWLSGAVEDRKTGCFGGGAWWAEYRKTHGLMWAAYAVTGRAELLLGDALLGAWVAVEHGKKSSEPVSV